MTVEISAQAIALRLLLASIAGAMIGVNRSQHGHPAGLRTTLLVTLAAAIAMIQANLLLSTGGKAPDAFASMDVMRLPLGILTGVGFIGAGAIVRKDEMIIGVTTAATLWFATVVGLCLGGGQLVLGVTAAILGLLILSTLRQVETRLDEQQRATLSATFVENSISEVQLRAFLEAGNVRVRSVSVVRRLPERQVKFDCEVRWQTHKDQIENPAVLNDIARLSGLIEISWSPAGASPL